MDGFDFDAARRWARFDPGRTLARRSDADLPFATERQLTGNPLLLDTCVYIDQMHDRAPPIVTQLIESRHINHSTIAVQELMHAAGAMRPDDPRTPANIRAIGGQIKAISKNRLFAPGTQVLGRGALLAGMLSRLQGYSHDTQLKAQQDCVLFLQALKLGSTVLTANVREFDLLLQLLPQGRVLFYRAE